MKFGEEQNLISLKKGWRSLPSSSPCLADGKPGVYVGPTYKGPGSGKKAGLGRWRPLPALLPEQPVPCCIKTQF
eukprot:3772487-Rhodomonas_salina.1